MVCLCVDHGVDQWYLCVGLGGVSCVWVSMVCLCVGLGGVSLCGYRGCVCVWVSVVCLCVVLGGMSVCGFRAMSSGMSVRGSWWHVCLWV